MNRTTRFLSLAAAVVPAFLVAANLSGAAEPPAAAPQPEAAAPAPGPGQPNIIFILADDLGMDAVRFLGGPFRTPHLDKLAAGSTVFERCYSTPLCGPSRCQFLTGRYPFRTGHVSNQTASAIDPSREIMIPAVLKRAGYATAAAGKWGQLPLTPQEWGFDESVIFRGSRYWLTEDKRGPTYLRNGQPASAPGKYFPDLCHEFIADFIARHKTRPFFLYYPMPHVHGPILPTPDSKPGADPKQVYADNIAYMDKLVGRLLEELDRQQLREKTVVVFTGDNGTARFGVDAGSALHGRPVNGNKGSLLEGGSRVPLIVHWPGTTPAGRRLADLVDFTDFFGTFAELAGAPLPPGVTLDSHSFVPQIKGLPGTPRDWVYVELNGRSYARDGRFKLTSGGELFDLSEAPFVEKPVPAGSPDAVAAAARQKLQKILDAHPCGKPQATGKKDFRRKGRKGKPDGNERKGNRKRKLPPGSQPV